MDVTKSQSNHLIVAFKLVNACKLYQHMMARSDRKVERKLIQARNEQLCMRSGHLSWLFSARAPLVDSMW